MVKVQASHARNLPYMASNPTDILLFLSLVHLFSTSSPGRLPTRQTRATTSHTGNNDVLGHDAR
jgi:hypothetical protein